MTTLLQDFRYGIRTLLGAPGFAVVSILTLALGIGATAVVYSFLMAVLTAAAPVQNMDRLAAIWSNNRAQGEPKNPVSMADFVEWRRRQRSFERFAAQRPGALNLSGIDRPVRVEAAFVTADYFDVLGIRPLLGRGFIPEEERPGGPRVAMLSERLWRERFGGRPDILGRDIMLDAGSAQIVGIVAADDFSGDVFVPLVLDPASPLYGERALFVMARLGPGVTLEQARAEMAAIGDALEREQPDTRRGWSVSTRPLQEEFFGPQARIIFGVLLGASAAVLLIGCANIANLLLARGLSRTRELAVRTALGASRLRLVRQMLAESLLLACCGGAGGLLVANWGLGVLRATFDIGASYMDRARIDGRVLAFAVVASLLSTIVFGLIPALHGARADVNQTLRDGSRATGTPRAHRLRSLLVAGEVAAAVLLLVVATLFLRTLGAIQRIEAEGFDPSHVLTLRVSLPEARYADGAAVTAFYEGVIDRLRSSPDVMDAGAGVRVPAAGSRYNPNRSVVIEGRPVQPDETLSAQDQTIMPGYLETLRIPLRAGRYLTRSDGAGAPLAVVISETMARKYWGGASPIGSRIRLGDETSQDAWRTVVGVVGNVRNDDIDAPAVPQVYVPLAQRLRREMTIVLRTRGDPLEHVATARAAVEAIDADQPVYEVKPMEQILEEDLRDSVVVIAMASIFAAVALALAAIGIYGVVAQSVAQRTHEIGVRMALGAAVSDVFGLVVRQGLLPVVAGLVVGIGGGLATARVFAGMLYGVTPTDPITYASAIALLVAVALVACMAPARRATRVNPLVALRCE